MVYNKKFYEMQYAENLRNKLMTEDKEKSKKLLEEKREYNKNWHQSMIII